MYIEFSTMCIVYRRVNLKKRKRGLKTYNPVLEIQKAFSIDIHLDMKLRHVLLTNRWSNEEISTEVGRKCPTADVFEICFSLWPYIWLKHRPLNRGPVL